MALRDAWDAVAAGRRVKKAPENDRLFTDAPKPGRAPARVRIQGLLETIVHTSPDQVSCDLSGEAAILKFKTGMYYGLDPLRNSADSWPSISCRGRKCLLAQFERASADSTLSGSNPEAAQTGNRS